MSEDITRGFEQLATADAQQCNISSLQKLYRCSSSAGSLISTMMATTDNSYDELLPYSPYYTPGLSSSVSSFSSSSCSSVISSLSSSSAESDYTPSVRSSISSSSASTISIGSRPASKKTRAGAKYSSIEPAVNSRVEERDIYGFRRPTQWVDPASILKFDEKYKSILARQEAKWDAFLQENQGQFPPLCAKLKRYTRKGIPRKYRAKAWMYYSGARSLADANPGVYQTMVEEAFSMGKDNEYAEVIYRDLHRTFPDNPFFCCAVPQQDGSVGMNPAANPNLLALQRVLMAFSVYCPHIGYCQSLNFITGILLLILESEEDAFWMLHVIVNEYFPEGMFDAIMEGATIEQTVLMNLVYDKMPGVWNKFGNKKCFWECENADNLPTITLVTSHWFLTLYINILPIETVLRIWDCMFIEGYKILFRVALTIIKQNDRTIRNVTDPIDVFQILQKMPRRILDCHEFMEQVFAMDSVSSDLTYRDLETRRSMFRERRRRRAVYSDKKRNVVILQERAYL